MNATGGAAAVILAAGRATRFGSNKMEADFRGRPMLEHVVDAAEAARLDPIVVVAARPAGGARARVVVNPDPARGLSSSLRLGLHDLSGTAAQRVVILLGDQPLVRSEVIAALLAQPPDPARPIAVPRYADGQPGNPVLLERAAWPLAEALTGDRGISQLYAARPELVRYVDMRGTNPDVDTPADLARLEG